MHTFDSPVVSSAAGPPAIMAIASSVVQDVFASILPNSVHFCTAAESRERSHANVEDIHPAGVVSDPGSGPLLSGVAVPRY